MTAAHEKSSDEKVREERRKLETSKTSERQTKLQKGSERRCPHKREASESRHNQRTVTKGLVEVKEGEGKYQTVIGK